MFIEFKRARRESDGKTLHLQRLKTPVGQNTYGIVVNYDYENDTYTDCIYYADLGNARRLYETMRDICEYIEEIDVEPSDEVDPADMGVRELRRARHTRRPSTLHVISMQPMGGTKQQYMVCYEYAWRYVDNPAETPGILYMEESGAINAFEAMAEAQGYEEQTIPEWENKEHRRV